MSATDTLRALHADFTQRRIERAERRHLKDELAAFSSPADLLELEAMVERYPTNKTADVRSVMRELNGQRLTR